MRILSGKEIGLEKGTIFASQNMWVWTVYYGDCEPRAIFVYFRIILLFGRLTGKK